MAKSTKYFSTDETEMSEIIKNLKEQNKKEIESLGEHALQNAAKESSKTTDLIEASHKKMLKVTKGNKK